MDTIFSETLLIVRSRSQRHKESEFAVWLDIIERFKSLDNGLDEGFDMVQVEGPCETGISWITEIEIDEEGLRFILSRAFHEIHTSSAIYHEVVVEEVEEFWIFFIGYDPFSTESSESSSHSCHGSHGAF